MGINKLLEADVQSWFAIGLSIISLIVSIMLYIFNRESLLRSTLYKDSIELMKKEVSVFFSKVIDKNKINPDDVYLFKDLMQKVKKGIEITRLLHEKRYLKVKSLLCDIEDMLIIMIKDKKKHEDEFKKLAKKITKIITKYYF